MKSQFSSLIAAIAVLVSAGCVDQQLVDFVTSGGEMEVQLAMDGPEALAWLQSNKNESALASNRFLETENAIKYVKALYKAGAVKVVVPKDTIRSDEDTMIGEGGPYADALVVTMPTEPGAREAVKQMCAAELRREGFDAREIEKSTQVYLWWD